MIKTCPYCKKKFTNSKSPFDSLDVISLQLQLKYGEDDNEISQPYGEDDLQPPHISKEGEGE